MIAVLCVLLHPLQVLLVAFKTPRVVFELRHPVALLQAQVQDLRLLMLLLLITVITAKQDGSYVSLARRLLNESLRVRKNNSYLMILSSLRLCLDLSLP